MADGPDKLKLVIGIRQGAGPAEDAARVRAVREAVGEGVELMVDANYLFAFPAALDLCRRIEPYGITWFEEPVSGNDPRLRANLRRQTRIPIAAGQNEGHKWRHWELILHEAVKVAALAQAFNLPVANGGGWPTTTCT